MLSMIDKIDCSSNAKIITESISNINYNVIINCLPLSVDIPNYLELIGYNFKLLDYYLDINYHINTQIQNKIKAEISINGIDMLIYQGIRSNEIWIQKDLQESIDCSKLRNYLSKQ